MKERRRYYRIPATIKVILLTETSTIEGNTVDLSEGGIRIQINKEDTGIFSKNKIEFLVIDNLRINKAEQYVKMVWMKDANSAKLYGIQFLNFPEDIKEGYNKMLQEITEKRNKMPKNRLKDYEDDFIEKRRQWIADYAKVELTNIGKYSIMSKEMIGNIENSIGACQVPLGLAGPLRINGEYAKGDFFVPLATTEGVLVMTYHRGMKVITRSGGANVRVLRDSVHISPVFCVENLIEGEDFIKWVETHHKEIKKEAESTTNYGILLGIEPIWEGRRMILKFLYYTEDAQGLNMINKATDKACQFIENQTGKKYLLRSNLSAIKKVSAYNIHCGQGKAVFAEITIPEDVIRLFGVKAKDMADYFFSTLLCSSHGGMVGENAHVANGIAAIFLACGQDIADVSVSHVGISMCEETSQGGLYVSTYLPNLFIGTVGGGTALPTQRECLSIMGCYGTGKAKKFAEIIGATVLAGEVAVLASLSGRTYVQAHEKYGRNKPSLNEQREKRNVDNI